MKKVRAVATGERTIRARSLGIGEVDAPSAGWELTVGSSEERPSGDESQAATGSRPVADAASGELDDRGARQPRDRDPFPDESQSHEQQDGTAVIPSQGVAEEGQHPRVTEEQTS